MRYCKNCGKPISEITEYCSYCGTKLEFQENEGKFVRQEKYRYCPNCGTKLYVDENQELARCSSCGTVFELHPITVNVGTARDAYAKCGENEAEFGASFTESVRKNQSKTTIKKSINSSCIYCGRNINVQINGEKDELYCPYCGRLIQLSQIQATEEAKIALENQNINDTAAKVKQYFEKGKKWNRRGNILVGIIISLWIIIIVHYLNGERAIIKSDAFMWFFLLQLFFLPLGIIFKLVGKWEKNKARSIEDNSKK
jgi:predicted RNA-binding Zn-ribbon protein involved in translation (DUF1610 family)